MRYPQKVSSRPPQRPRAAVLPPGTTTYLRAWREHRGLTQTALAERAGTAPATVSRIESGKLGYSQDLIERLADALEVSASELIFMDPKNPAAYFQMLLNSSEEARAGLAQTLAEGLAAYGVAPAPGKYRGTEENRRADEAASRRILKEKPHDILGMPIPSEKPKGARKG